MVRTSYILRYRRGSRPLRCHPRPYAAVRMFEHQCCQARYVLTCVCLHVSLALDFQLLEGWVPAACPTPGRCLAHARGSGSIGHTPKMSSFSDVV